MFYEGTKKRISVSKGGEKELEPSNIENASDDYANFITELQTLCDQALGNNLSQDEVSKIMWLKSRIKIEL